MYNPLSFHFKAFVRLLAIMALCLLVFFAYQKQFYYTLFSTAVVVAVLMVEFYFFQRKYYYSIDRIVLAMLYDDFPLKSDKKQSNPTLQNLQLLYRKLQSEQQKNDAKEMVYLNIFNNIETGIVILEQREEQWKVFFINDYFSEYFEIPKIRSWENFKRQLPGLALHLEEKLGFKESKGPIDIRVEDGDKQTFFIVLLDSIQRVLDKKERDTWQNLMKIISHEIMNSLTPIHSLAHNTRSILQEEQLTDEDLSDIRISTDTIVNRTNHLQGFIENYRKLTMLPSPQKHTVSVDTVLQNSLRTMEPVFRQYGIVWKTNIEAKANLLWDEQQMEQVFINLLTNAVYTVKDEVEKSIVVEVTEKNNRLLIAFTDSGKGISDEIKDKIFMPFYTTRESGAGIGLPLSKNIVEMHNGYLTYLRKNNHTHFVVNFSM